MTPTARDLLALASKALGFAEHKAQCPSVHGWTVDANGVRRPCICGLDDLIARARAAREAVEAEEARASVGGE